MLASLIRPATVALCAALLGLPACGGGGDGDGGGLAHEVTAVVEELERAIASRDFERVCADLLSAEVRRQAGGGECPAMLARTSAGLRRPRIEIERVKIDGATATVDVTTSARGQEPAADQIRLVREDGAYRIASLTG